MPLMVPDMTMTVSTELGRRRQPIRALLTDDRDRRLGYCPRRRDPCFSRKNGFNGTTVRDIADAVGILSGSLFYHFASKQDILCAVIEEGLRNRELPV